MTRNRQKEKKMSCFTRCGNFCCPNTPNPIWVIGSCSNSNDVINPIIPQSFGFFQNTLGGSVPTGSIIPVTLSSSRGGMVTQSTTTSGAVNLMPGTYEITYFVNGTVPASGTLSVALRANGVQVAGSTTSVTQTASNQVAVSKTIVLSVPTNTTLELYNAGTDALTISNANILVKEI